MSEPRADAGHASDPPRALSLRLREETRAAHERVERTASFNRLIVVRLPEPSEHASAEDQTRRDRAVNEYREIYRRFLIAAHGFEAAVERCLTASPRLAVARAVGFADENPTGVTLIRDDLASLYGNADPQPGMDALPEPRSLAELVGIEYVRRGSRAGGAVIGAVVAHNLGLTRERGATFLLRYGRETRSVIAGFKTWVDGLGLDESGTRQATASAIATFEAVERWHRKLERDFERAPGM